eukprot:CAMPEP_0198215976 /NCGR_PEP_ID=MMETSP1445-20131203/53996_1 /TAXON_ID=36898 /ORGANISM="Pyramimonas sp., Strain CCMP2087" /LENGTH=69 /DNA_ID=CAMNT_0043891971 /DNA_START=264 /DNA_END=473 /DNA_ORIENTATION=+
METREKLSLRGSIPALPEMCVRHAGFSPLTTAGGEVAEVAALPIKKVHWNHRRAGGLSGGLAGGEPYQL